MNLPRHEINRMNEDEVLDQEEIPGFLKEDEEDENEEDEVDSFSKDDLGAPPANLPII
jgi:hypothetical protein